jgi:hypothetical protein
VEFLRSFGTRWGTAWNSHDTDQVLDLLDDDITWDDNVFWPHVIHGISGMRAYVDTIWKVMPDVAFEESPVLHRGGRWSRTLSLPPERQRAKTIRQWAI